MKYSYNPFDFWGPTFQAAAVITEANIAVTMRMMDMATNMNPYMAHRPTPICGAPARPQTPRKTRGAQSSKPAKRKPSPKDA